MGSVFCHYEKMLLLGATLPEIAVESQPWAPLVRTAKNQTELGI